MIRHWAIVLGLLGLGTFGAAGAEPLIVNVECDAGDDLQLAIWHAEAEAAQGVGCRPPMASSRDHAGCLPVEVATLSSVFSTW